MGLFEDLLKPENIKTLASCFLMGYAFRAVERSVRNAPKEEEIHTVVLGIVWSTVFAATLPLVSRPFPPNIPKDWQPAITLASYVVYSATIGLVWGAIRPHAQFMFDSAKRSISEKSAFFARSLNAELSDKSHTQAHAKFFRTLGKRQVILRMKNGKIYLGQIDTCDSDSGGDDGRLILKHCYIRKDTGWELLPGIDSMLIGLKEVESFSHVNWGLKLPEKARKPRTQTILKVGSFRLVRTAPRKKPNENKFASKA